MGKNKRKGKSRNQKKRNLTTGATSSTQHSEDILSSNTEVCPNCGHNTSSDSELPGLKYCAHCSLFFWEPKSNGGHHSLTSVMSAIRRISGSDILFSERIPGIVSAIIPDIDDGLLEILRRLHRPESESLVEAIRKDKDLNEIEIALFVNKAGLDWGKVVTICNVLRRVLDKSIIESTDSPLNPQNQYILDLSSTMTEVLPNEKIQIRWIAVEDSKLTYILTSNDGSKKIKPNGSLWISPDQSQEVTLKVLYRNRRIDSRSILIKVVSLPVIHHLSCNLPSPVMETERLQINWNVENAERVTLIHHYNDYEKLSVDVTEFGGVFAFTALRTENLELIAERRKSRVTKSLMIDVIPLPRIKISEIPQIGDYSEIGSIRMPNLIDHSKIEDLFNVLRGITSLSELKPYNSLRGNFYELFRLMYRLIK